MIATSRPPKTDDRSPFLNTKYQCEYVRRKKGRSEISLSIIEILLHRKQVKHINIIAVKRRLKPKSLRIWRKMLMVLWMKMVLTKTTDQRQECNWKRSPMLNLYSLYTNLFIRKMTTKGKFFLGAVTGLHVLIYIIFSEA